MQEREIIYKILFSSVAPYLLIIANLIIVVCIIKILWITVKNKNKKISSQQADSFNRFTLFFGAKFGAF